MVFHFIDGFNKNDMNLLTALTILFISLIPIPPDRVETFHRPASFRSETTPIHDTKIVSVLQSVPTTRLKASDLSTRLLAQLPVDKTPTATIKVVKTPVKVTPAYGVKVVNRTAVDFPQADKEYVKSRVCAVFAEHCAEALIIAFHESGYSTNAVSATGDFGVMQLNCRWQKRRVGGDCTRFLDLETNLQVAKQIFNEQGWNPWSTKKYL